MALKKCCCCFNLRCGVQVLAIVYGIMVVLGLIGNITTLCTVNLDKVGRATIISEIVLSIFFAATCIFLYIGATNRKKSFLIPWLVVVMISILLRAIFLVAICIVWPQADNIPLHFTIAAILVLLFAIAVNLYFWVVVFSLYKSIQEDLPTHLVRTESGLRQSQGHP